MDQSNNQSDIRYDAHIPRKSYTDRVWPKMSQNRSKLRGGTSKQARGILNDGKEQPATGPVQFCMYALRNSSIKKRTMLFELLKTYVHDCEWTEFTPFT